VTCDVGHHLANIQRSREAKHEPGKGDFERLHAEAQHVHEHGRRLRLHQHLELAAYLLCVTLHVTRHTKKWNNTCMMQPLSLLTV
jgi:hypothetical protein